MCVTSQLIAEARLCAEIRDCVRHRWREETGQIPPGSPMATSWSGDTRPHVLARHFPEGSRERHHCEFLALVETLWGKEG